MKKILLVCDLGMSTSLIVKKMKDAAEKKQIPVHIEAKGLQNFKEQLSQFDCAMLGPQIAYKLASCQEVGRSLNKPVVAIDMMSYGMADGEKILEQALKLLE